MDIVRRVHAMKEVSRLARAGGRKIGFVPTMGCLHEGHLSLIRRVKELSDVVVVSIFANPAQFEDSEDLERYPRDLARDADLCIAEGVGYLFTPEAEEMYPAGSSTFVEVEALSSRIEGASRPGHFRGVATVVLKLFAIVRPDVAAFGQKDAQQAIILQRMVRDLMLDVELIVLPTVRDSDGVAMSSRNVHLTPEERRAARAVHQSLKAAEKAVSEGTRDPGAVIRAARSILEAEPLLRADYVELLDTDSLEPVSTLQGEMLLAVAAVAGKVRLIDNTVMRV